MDSPSAALHSLEAILRAIPNGFARTHAWKDVAVSSQRRSVGNLSIKELSNAKDPRRDPATLFVVNGLGIGGSERKTVTIVNDLYGEGWDVHLAYLTDRTAGIGRLHKDVPLVCLGRKGKLSVQAVKRLRDYICDNRIRKVFCINLYPLLYVFLATRVRIPSGDPSAILMVNTTNVVGWKPRAQMIIYRPLIRWVSAVVFGCRSQLEIWCRRYGLDVSQCRVIYNGVDVSRFSRAAPVQSLQSRGSDAELEQADFVIGAIGQLREEKNHIELITVMDRIMAKLPRAKLMIIGEGPERDRLSRAIQTTQFPDRVTLLGQIGDVRPLLRRFDVFVLPSISETFSNAVLEAMSMEVPVVISDTGGTREMVEDGVDGFIYKQGDVDSLIELILRLATNSQLRLQVGKRARATVLERFTNSTMMLEYRKLLNEE